MSTPWTVRPFDEAEIGRALPEVKQRMHEFNKRLSSMRIISEHAYGRLKGRFLGLKAAGKHHDIEDLYKAIEALLILHNICMDWNDHPEDITNFDPRELPVDDENEEQDPDENPPILEGDANIPLHETDQWLKEQGYAKRNVLLEYLFPAPE
ncbi:hypothetical protein DICSQDRAFT_64153 [Dichomitus squalens LYAD-421 SS1]|uniref:DDE Tnp4 domain-containing protein n=1 Tax=Dichomitus squalens (strain LYAD-421) TaxID=732165 RepID=R7SVW6_DICSQ|nr:uncharacterized protein DICSQDRAFT_64153 [Dichomitus squalens LYAD-421 SS1]EJF59915.1 hypothetical protein DICSQDRAFT_64153 [Dichomitus squalens LYAD-421 SS1]